MRMAEESDGASGSKRMISDLKRWSLGNLRYAADLILPPVCLHCHMPILSHASLCADCWQDIDFITPPLCDRLGVPLTYYDGEITLSEAARRDPPLYGRARAVARFKGVMRNLIHSFKYADRHEAAPMFASMMRSAGAQLIQDADILVPVPLHRAKLWTRRYNQAAILAKHLAAITELELHLFALRRIRQTPSQVGLSAEARRANVASAFAVKHSAKTHVRGKRVLLIDDVITTGATLEGCTRALKQAGAKDVDCLALAMADFGNTD